MPETKRPLKAFLCHSSSDKPKVRELYRRLVADGVDAWLDTESLLPGQKWKEEIQQAIRNSDVILVFLSKDSINKEGFVQKEIKEALDIADEKPEHTIFIIPARLEDCNVPDRLADYHWVDLYDSSGYKKLIQALETRAKTVNATLLPERISKVDEVKSKAVEFEKRGDFAKSLSTYLELKKLDPSYSGIDEKIQELELKSLESQAIQYELRGDFWSALKIWYKIKHVDHLYPRVDIKIRELEQAFQHKQIPQLKAAKQESQAHQGLGRKAILAFLGGIALILFAVIGSPILVSVISRTPTPTITVTPTKKLILTKTIVPTATKTKIPTSTSTSTLTPVPQSSFLLQEDFEDNTVSSDWSSVYTIQKDAKGNHYWLATATGAEYPSAWYFAKGTDDWKDYAFEVRIKFIKDGGIFIGSYAYPNGVSSFFVSYITSDGYVRLVEYNLPTFGWRVIDGTEKKSLITRNEWYLVRFEVQDGQLSTYVDNKLVTNTDIPQPAASESGTIGFYIGKDDEVYIDDIKVWQLK
ncbi:MAG TPA: TIR domain-containing protein [Anaerolineales bacterium]|nr:TIR domain-containing protein [Anaerolineales bacterium]